MRSGIVLLAICGLCAVGTPAKPPKAAPQPTVVLHAKGLPAAGLPVQIVSPRDPASGMPTGRRSIKFKTSLADSRKLMKALCGNENLTVGEYEEISFARGGKRQYEPVLYRGGEIKIDKTAGGRVYYTIEWTSLGGGKQPGA